MIKVKITIEIDDRKAKAIKMYLDKRKGEDQPTLEKIVQDAACAAFDKTYAKVVPKDVRDFIELSE